MLFFARAPRSLGVVCLPVVVCAIFFQAYFVEAQAVSPAGPNADPTYQALRNLTLGGESFTVANLDLKRDAGTFHLRSGTVCFAMPVQGQVTGAVFVGDGNFVLTPPSATEASSLKLLTKENEFSENFNHLVLRFTDSTYQDIKKSGTAGSTPCDAGLLKDSQNTTRHRLHYNLSARLLEDVLGNNPSGLFFAFIHGKRYNDKLLFMIDPHGAPEVAPEEVELMTYDENKSGIWTAFRLSPEYRKSIGGSAHNFRFHIEHQVLDVTIEKNANLSGKATTTFVARGEGLRVVPFDLHSTLRVQSVTAEDGQGLAFIQEDKNDDPEFYVILPKALPASAGKVTITTTYGGKDAVFNEGNGNYYPVARENWFPSSGGGLGDYTNFDMTFHIPKGMKMAATGSLISESNDSGQNVTVWKSDIAQPVAGFQFGKMKEEDAKLTSPAGFVVAAYANEEPPSWASRMTGGTMGTLSTVSMMKGPLSEAQYAVGLYTEYFGPLPFKRLSMTQQTACNYGQSWPELVWLPTCSFYDSTVRHQLGLDWGDRGYWKVVAPHEVAHQWWGQLVGFDSYRDQWMSEGFADFSASLFLENAYGKKSQKEFHDFWEDERKSVVEKNAMGFRPIDVGPVTMGYRLNNSRTGGSITRDLIYPKGAYILHMVRMMMWNRQTGDQQFKETMRDFVKTYAGRAASTEDFKAMVEKHMTAEMKAFGNGSMDWFFNEYVYGTALPAYHLDYANFDPDANGDLVFSFKATQAGVNENFRMLVPIYFELADGHTIFIGRAQLVGNSSTEQKVALKGLKEKPRGVFLNYNDDVLAAKN
jgi:Peptidase family M1 domain